MSVDEQLLRMSIVLRQPFGPNKFEYPEWNLEDPLEIEMMLEAALDYLEAQRFAYFQTPPEV